MIQRNFVCNRTAERFLKDTTNAVQLLFGPVGCGKSSTAMVRLYMDAMLHVKPGHDGVRRCRTVVIRNTYSQLKTTTIKTWCEWFPQEIFGDVRGDSPMTHHIKQDGIDWEVIFLAVDSLSDMQRLKSLEVTNAYLNEAQFIGDVSVLEQVLERTNRYPGKIFGGGLGDKRVYLDCNPPSTRHWIYQKFELEKPEGWIKYHYPPALLKVDEKWVNNPAADYVEQQNDPEYWVKNARGASEEYIKVSLCGEYGILEEGRPVHKEYNDRLHYADKVLIANDQIELGLGWDFGNTPACIVVQLMPDGQLLILDEFWTDYMSVRGFAQNVVIPQLDKLYPWWRENYISRHDPAGQAMNADGGTCQEILRELGIISMPADSNAAEFRRDAMKYFLTRMPEGKPGLLVSSKCQLIREGLMGKYQYELIKSTALSGDKQYQEKPKKNIWSHSLEACEYIQTHYAQNVKAPKKSETKPYIVASGNFMGR